MKIYCHPAGPRERVTISDPEHVVSGLGFNPRCVCQLGDWDGRGAGLGLMVFSDGGEPGVRQYLVRIAIGEEFEYVRLEGLHALGRFLRRWTPIVKVEMDSSKARMARVL